MKLKPYEAYKDSGVEWLGRVPIGWTLTRLKFIASSTKGKNPPEILDEQVDGSLPYLSMDYLRSQVEPKFAYIDKSSCKVDDGKVLLLWDGANAGEFIKGKSGILSSTSALLNPSSTLQKDYFWFYCKTIEHDVRRQAVGMGIPHVNGDELKSTVFAKPSFVEQQQIATFLDRETTKIDTLISKQEKLIALLQENRQAVISNAVTKGLNPDAPMKDSGVEWLGMVPVGWARTQIKHIVKIPVTDGPHETPDFIDDGVPFVSAEAVSSGVIDFNKIRGYISKEANEIYSLKYSPKRNDIYMVKSGATTGVAAIVDTDLDFNIWSPLAVIRCNENMSPKFVLNFIRSRNLQEGVELNWSFGTQQNIGMGVIENLFVTVPPLIEQKLIVSYLDEQTTKINKLIEKAKRSIELSKEHRSALISAAVTGKIDVRGLIEDKVAA